MNKAAAKARIPTTCTICEQLHTSRIPPRRIGATLSPEMDSLTYILVVAQTRAVLETVVGTASLGTDRTAHTGGGRVVVAWGVDSVIGVAIV